MTIYIVAQINIHDREAYSVYEAGFAEIFQRHQGRMLAVDEDPHLLEGQWSHTRTVLIEFPDKDAALAWYQSDDYQTLAEHRFAASVANTVILSGLNN